MTQHRQARPRLKVSILSAKGLRSADFSLSGGSSDPYCICQISGRPQQQIKTPTIRKCLEPVWNHEGQLECAEGEFIEFHVMDYDAVGEDDLLGKAVLEYEDFAAFGYSGDLTLSATGTSKAARLTVKVEVLPERVQGDCRAFVRIYSCNGLRGADFGGKSDPYCTCEIPGKPESKFTTRVMSKMLDPIWDEEDELRGYDPEDPVIFNIYDYDKVGSDDLLGTLELKGSDFFPNGWTMREAPLDGGTGRLKFGIDVILPEVPVKRHDPGENVRPEDRQPAPFQLRSLDTGRSHRLLAWTSIGRSERKLDPRTDLILRSPGIADISRIHAIIKCWPGADPSNWFARIYDDKGGGGSGLGPGGGHAGGGTTVDGEPVDTEVGTPIEPGNVIRFGVNELWVVERAAIHQKSHLAEVAISKARQNASEDPSTFRSLKVPSAACNMALQHCDDWDSLVRVVLEWCGEPDEPPCVDIIEVMDEIGKSVSRHLASTLEEQQAFKVKKVLQDVRMGTTLKLRLSSDPCLLAPILGKLENHRKQLEATHEKRKNSIFGAFGVG